MKLLPISRIGGLGQARREPTRAKLGPRGSGGELAGIVADAGRSRHELVIENVLRHQHRALGRRVKNPGSAQPIGGSWPSEPRSFLPGV